LSDSIEGTKFYQDPPNLMSEEDAPPALPRRPANEIPEHESTPISTAPEPEPISNFWDNDELEKQRAYEEEQRRLREQREAELQRQNLLVMQQQREFEERQRLQAEQQRLAEEQLMRDQYARQAQGHVAELERQLLELQGQQNNNLLLLESYDSVRSAKYILEELHTDISQKVKALEHELATLNLNSQQQQQSKDDLIKSLQG
jgi:hypothetical protein